MIAELIGLAILFIFTVLAIWLVNMKQTQGPTLLFLLCAGLSMIIALESPDTLSATTSTTSTDVTVGLALYAYSLLCFAFAMGTMFWSGEVEDED